MSDVEELRERIEALREVFVMGDKGHTTPMERRCARHGFNEAFKLLWPCVDAVKELLDITPKSVSYPDPQHQNEVSELGKRIGFGALMHAANYAWQEYLKESDMPDGSEFTLGHCASVVESINFNATEQLAHIEAELKKAGV